MNETKIKESGLIEIEESSSTDSPVKYFNENSFQTHPSLNELQSTELAYADNVRDILRQMYEVGRADPNYVFQGSARGLTPLAMACRADNVEAVRFLLSQGAHPTIHLAHFHIRSVEVAKVFVEFGANLKVKGWYGNTLLHSVCIRNNVALAEYYIAQGLSVDEQNDFGQTPVHHAYSRLISVPNNNSLQTLTNLPLKQEKPRLFVNVLGKMGPGHENARALFSDFESSVKKRPKLPRMDSGTPRELCYPLIQLFLKYGGSSVAVDKLGFTPWDYAEASGSAWVTALEKLMRGIKYDEYELFQSLREGNAEPLLEHLAEGRSPDVIERCASLVHVASNNGDCPALSALIERKAKVDLRLTPPECNADYLFGRTPLFSVCGLMNSPQRLQAMQMLVSAGANVNTPCEGFLTPFLLLCQHGRARAIRVMIHDAYEQLMSAEIFADKPVIDKKFNHKFKFTRLATKNEVGNAALKTLCEMFIADEQSVEKCWNEHELAMARYQQAQQLRHEALAAIGPELESFRTGQSSKESLDSALARYRDSSESCRTAQHEQHQACDLACQQMSFHQSEEYQTSHRQLGDIIQRMVAQVELNPEIRVLINSNEALQQRCATTELASSSYL